MEFIGTFDGFILLIIPILFLFRDQPSTAVSSKH